MSRDPNYRRLISSARWQHLAIRTKLQANYTCQRCGLTTERLAVHHVRPVESGRNLMEMEALCFSPSNLQVLCYQCHKDVHEEASSRSKQGHQQAEQRRIDRFLMGSIDPSTLPPDF